MGDTIDYPQFCRMLQAAVEQIRTHHAMLSKLDSAVGDGDHGTTLLRIMESVSKTVIAHPANDLKGMLSSVAWEVMGCDGGSSSSLLGSFFLGMSDAAADRTTLDLAGLVALFEGGITKLARQSRAQVGDKTMMDAFLPALNALKAAVIDGSVKGALQKAAEAAAAGAEATKTMRAKFGRARNLGDRVLGHADPGAVSVSLLFKGFYEGV